MLLLALKKLYNSGVIIRSITYDGAVANINAFQKLGCIFIPGHMKTSFEHPCTNTNVYVILDPCHMIKLCRNTFAEKELFSKSGKISFKYVKELHNIQNIEGLKFANRLSLCHINFKQKKNESIFSSSNYKL